LTFEGHPSRNLVLSLPNLSTIGQAVPAGSAWYGWCCQAGKGIPINFTVAAEYFKKAADLNDECGANSFGASLERGEGVDEDIG
jgi:TPR repeat protein